MRMKGAVAPLLSLRAQDVQVEECGHGGVGGRVGYLQAFDQRGHRNDGLAEQSERDSETRDALDNVQARYMQARRTGGAGRASSSALQQCFHRATRASVFPRTLVAVPSDTVCKQVIVYALSLLKAERLEDLRLVFVGAPDVAPGSRIGLATLECRRRPAQVVQLGAAAPPAPQRLSGRSG